MAEELKAFKREDRYIVLKLSDLSALPEVVGRPFAENLTAIQRRLPKRECLVIESDWPEYQVAWQMIEERINGSAQLPSQGGEAIEVVASIAVDAEGVVRDFTLEPGLDRHPSGYTVTPLMTVAQHQRIMAASVGSGEPVFMWHRGATEEESEVVDVDCACPCCVPLYTHPADQVADDLTMVKVSRELLELLCEMVDLHDRRGAVLTVHMEHLRALLDKPCSR